MAQEIQQSVGLSVTNGDFKLPRIGTTTRIDQTTKGGGVPGFIVAVITGQGTSVTAVGLTALGVCYIKNIDPVNYVQYGPDNAGVLIPFGKLKPGEEATFRLYPGISWWVRANTANCKCIVQILDD